MPFDPAREMDPSTLFVHLFCNKLADSLKGFRQMASWYVFGDQRPGSVEERFDLDARSWAEYNKMFGGRR